MKKLSLLLCMVLGLWSCGDDDPIKEPEPTPGPDTEEHAPVIKIESATATENSVEIKFVVEDAERAVYKVILEDAVLPTAAELFADKEAVEVKGTGTVQKSGLDANKKYKVVAAASYGETMSKVATLSFVTNPSTVSMSFLSAVGSFQGRSTENGTAIYIIDFSTDEFSVDGSVEHYPISHLYVALSGDANSVDLNNLSIPVGTYTLGDNAAPAVGKFYAGGIEDDTPYNTYIATQQEANGEIGVDLISDGQIVISPTENAGKYKVEIHFIYADGTKLEATYEGALAVDNDSDEKESADELERPISELTNDVVVNLLPNGGYCSFYGSMFSSYPNLEYVHFQLCADDPNAPSEYIQLGLLVDVDEYGQKTIPVGTYPIMDRKPSEFTHLKLSSIAGFRAATSTVAMEYGCWYYHYETWLEQPTPLVTGEVEILEAEGLNVKMKITLKDNAPTPNTITAEFEGTLFEI